jgi:hypothetical protein
MNLESAEYNKTGFGRWSWFALIEKLANKDITKFDEVTEQNFIMCLNILSYWKEQQNEQKRIEEKK